MEEQDIQELLEYISEKTCVDEQKAFEVIWYLQERMKLIPSKYEICQSCGCIYNSDIEGYWDEQEGGFCGCNS